MSKEKILFKIKKPKNLNTIFGLPASSYTDESFWKKECNTALSDGWLFVGFVHELKKPGDVIPIFIAEKPILIVKNNNNEITAFHNVCSHRCLKLVDEKKNVGKIIRCPYHSWSYDLEGKLKSAPHIGGIDQHKPKGFNFSDHGLKPIRIQVWHDWIFINLNGKAKKFEEYAKPLIKKFNDIDLTKLKYAATLNFGKINTNWKFLIENFIEPYHVQFVHKTTTNQPLKNHYTVVDGICYGSGVDVEKEDTKNSAALSVTSRYLSLFPNFIIGTYFPNQVGVYLNIPISPGVTSQKRIIYTTDGKKMSKEEANMIKNIWWSVHKEDHEMCERLQEGRSSPASNEGGLLSPVWEKGVQAFQKLIIDSTMKSKKIMKRKKNV
ncbi:aromatic ring-hydroxylating dioxygenase subunit alpha [Candidatus Pelagibacter sp.]|jgi:choline monooxygenase|nr:aromatic ring-hydroxylating dioxygenase subunit alpha [Candidatus Pelagibacter sp.]|tara:strand:- start:58 stop:1194 length:1137 start_codon:yes stop_codon:yes gene_type:complete